jgi:hypothetical protein
MIRWEIRKVTRRVKVISETEREERLAVLWETLVKEKGQFESASSQKSVSRKPSCRLSNPLLKRYGT